METTELKNMIIQGLEVGNGEMLWPVTIAGKGTPAVLLERVRLAVQFVSENQLDVHRILHKTLWIEKPRYMFHASGLSAQRPGIYVTHLSMKSPVNRAVQVASPIPSEDHKYLIWNIKPDWENECLRMFEERKPLKIRTQKAGKK